MIMLIVLYTKLTSYIFKTKLFLSFLNTFSLYIIKLEQKTNHPKYYQFLFTSIQIIINLNYKTSKFK